MNIKTIFAICLVFLASNAFSSRILGDDRPDNMMNPRYESMMLEDPVVPDPDKDKAESYSIIPVPKEIELKGGHFSFENSLSVFSDNEVLEPLYNVLKKEFKTLFLTEVVQSSNSEDADIILKVDGSLEDEAYRIKIQDQIEVTGGSYRAVSMGTASVLQSITEKQDRKTIPKGIIEDSPDLQFRGLMVDLARKKHHLSVLKQIVSLCRWYKIHYLHLHLTDDNSFRFPSDAYPQLTTDEFHYTKDELAELIEFANERGVEIIPELEVPGHAGQFIEKMPDIFGFQDEELNRTTINMTSEEIYPVLDTLVGEFAELFHSSEYIHIGGDEPDFSGMDEDPQVQQYLKSNEFGSVEELYWHFINRMNEFVEKRNKKSIVWEGFSKEGNNVVSKDIIVMAWETMYQRPEDLLDAGFDVINVSWKPLYVVNTRKWEPQDIYDWDVYQWQNWLPKAPSYDTIQIDENKNVRGASMASWDQPEYTEISSLRKRVPAMVERVWNKNRVISDEEFLQAMNQLDVKLDNYFSPVEVQASGLSYPDVADGHKDEQTWFGDTLKLKLTTPRNLVVRYTTDGRPVSHSSSLYRDKLMFSETTTLRYRAYTSDGEPVGHEILSYYELHPLTVKLEGENLIQEDQLWERVDSWRFPFTDSLKIHISTPQEGEVRYEKGGEVTANSPVYEGPITIKDDVFVEAGLFKEDSLVGEKWNQHFKKVDENELEKK
ncbi:MAG: family 20 glycosylhydrolase [Marinilabiliaceae bacterium]